MLEGREVKWRSGCLIKAIVKHIKNYINYERCRSRVKGVYLIIDEVNRADVDKAFGEFFLIFSSHNPQERIIPLELVEEIKSYVDKDMADEYARDFVNYLGKYLEEVRANDAVIGYRVPTDFRIIATMNQVDVRNLFTVGDAFARRFAIVEIMPPDDPKQLLDKLYENIRSELGTSINEIDNIIEDIRKLIDDKLIKLYAVASRKTKGQRKETIAINPISPASLYTAIKAFAILYFNKKENGENFKDLNNILRKCIEASLPLSRLWDDRVKRGINEVLKNVFEEETA